MRLGGLLLLGPWLAAGCDHFGALRAEGRPVSSAYSGAPGIRILDVDSPMRPARKIPVVRTPEVFAAYVPAHVERDLLIGDHWIYFKLKEADFFIEEIQDPDPPTNGEVPAELLPPLRRLNWEDTTIPHRKAGDSKR